MLLVLKFSVLQKARGKEEEWDLSSFLSHVGELLGFLKCCGRRNELSFLMKSVQQVWALFLVGFVLFCLGLGFFGLLFLHSSAQGFFGISTGHRLGKKMNQLIITETGPGALSVPFKGFIQWRGKPLIVLFCVSILWEKLNHY